MGKDRLKRFLIIIFVAFLVLAGAKVFADWQGKKKAQGEVLSFPTAEIGEKISDFGEQVLGKAVDILPGNSALKEKIIIEKESTNTETEKVEKVEIKTQEIIEIIKELPAEQLENIKKQIFKDFCQKVLEE